MVDTPILQCQSRNELINDCEWALCLQGGAETAPEEQRWSAKGASRRSDVVGALRSGLDRLAEVSNKALTRVGSSDLLHRFWACLEVCMLLQVWHMRLLLACQKC